MRKVLVLGLLFGTLAAWNTGCTGDDDDDDNHVPPDSITISGGTAVTVGSSLQLTATAVGGSEPGDVTTASTWTTNSAGVATVGAATGLVTGVSAGTATISADHDGVIGQVVLTVSTGAAAASSLTFNGTGWPHDTFIAYTRILEGTAIVDCQASAAIAGNAFSVNFGSILEVGHSYTYETFVDLNSDTNYENNGSDHRWTGNFTAVAGTTTVTVPHANAQAALTWQPNAGCPGT